VFHKIAKKGSEPSQYWRLAEGGAACSALIKLIDAKNAIKEVPIVAFRKPKHLSDYLVCTHLRSGSEDEVKLSFHQQQCSSVQSD